METLKRRDNTWLAQVEFAYVHMILHEFDHFEHELYSEKDTRAIVSTHSAKMQPFASSTWARFLPKAVRATRHGRRNYHVAVVGSGPAGFYTSKYLFKRLVTRWRSTCLNVCQHLLALCASVWLRIILRSKMSSMILVPLLRWKNFKYYGNVEVGTQPSLEALRKTYDAVVLCTGASGERILGIPGEDSLGVLGAQHLWSGTMDIQTTKICSSQSLQVNLPWFWVKEMLLWM